MTALDREEVFHHLRFAWSWRGLGVVHLVMVLVPTMGYLCLTTFVEMLPMRAVAPLAAGLAAAICVLQYRQPEIWLWRYVANAAIAPLLLPRQGTAYPPLAVPPEALL